MKPIAIHWGRRKTEHRIVSRREIWVPMLVAGSYRILFHDGSGWVLEAGEWRAESAPGLEVAP